MKYSSGSLSMMPPGMVLSTQIEGRPVRRETVFLDGQTFHRFTLNPGMRNEFTTFYSTDEQKLLNAVIKRAKRILI
jgi:hypothetical protein